MLLHIKWHSVKPKYEDRIRDQFPQISSLNEVSVICSDFWSRESTTVPTILVFHGLKLQIKEEELFNAGDYLMQRRLIKAVVNFLLSHSSDCTLYIIPLIKYIQ